MGYEDTKLLIEQFQANFTMLSKKFDIMHNEVREDLKDGLSELKGDLLRCQALRDKIIKRVDELEKVAAIDQAIDDIEKKKEEKKSKTKHDMLIWFLKYIVVYATPIAVTTAYWIKELLISP